jgi:anthranilate synthase/aminodeoxychorismate synthase-like glutamine amidotransferase
VILVIDNYDSFVHNLARYLKLLGQQTQVVRNDAVQAADIANCSPAAIVFSPGPCTPDEAGGCLEIARRLRGRVPMLGICLGHQVLGQALGGAVVRARRPMHGQASDVFHAARDEFQGIPIPFRAGRYHSLVVRREDLPAPVEVTAWTADGTVMALRHRAERLVGWQFHPESILTEHGFQLLANWLEEIEQGVPDVPAFSRELSSA